MGVTIFRPGRAIVLPGIGIQVHSVRHTEAAGGGTPPLDGISNVAVAYSLRQLRTAYSGSAVRVRRSSDSTEQDIGFVAGEFDSSAFSSFVGGGSGYVKTWYDQSGNALDVTQATTSRQPTITLAAVNGRAAVTFTAANSTHLVSSSSYAHFPIKRGGLMVVAASTATGSARAVGTHSTASTAWIYLISTSGTLQKWYDTATAFLNAASADTQNVAQVNSVSRTGDTVLLSYRNGVLINTFTLANSQTTNGALSIGADTGGAVGLTGHIVDVIQFSAAMPVADHNTIGNDMATRYGLSWTTVT